MTARAFLKIAPTHEQLESILPTAVEEFAERDNWPPDLVFKLNLALEELGVNIVNYSGATGDIEISLVSDEESVTVEISDDGLPFNPLLDKETPDIAAPPGRPPYRRARHPPGAVDDGRDLVQQRRRQEQAGDDQAQVGVTPAIPVTTASALIRG